MKRLKTAGSVLVVLLAITLGLAFWPPAGPRSIRVFEPDRMADLEVDMWQAYYNHESLRLFRGLLTTLHEQYRYSWAKAGVAGFHLARAARTFGDTRSNYEQV